MNWNILHLNDNPGSGEPEIAPSYRNRCLPKPRNKFTMSQLLLSKETLPKYEKDDLMAMPSALSNSSSEFASMPSQLTKEKKSLHGSMENLHKPKNHRSTNRLSDLSCRTKESAEMNEHLIQENLLLLKTLQATKKKALGLRVTSTFVLNALRGQKDLNEKLKEAKQRKDEEAAARMILHNLLLNSWRNCKAELDSLIEDNTQLNKSMENLSLQLRVVRHLQTSDKEKAQEKTIEVERMKLEITHLKDDSERSHSEIERMENELNSLQASIQNLKDQNKKFEEDALLLVEQNENLGRCLDTEKNKCAKLGAENVSLKDKISHFEKQLEEATKQNNHWQEQARAFESESWGLKLDIESKESKIKEIKTACEALREEKAKLIQIKAQLKAQLDDYSDQLQQTNFDKEELTCDLEHANNQLKEQVERIEKLECSLKNARKEYTEIEKELLNYKVQNVKRRRDWANALYFMVNPIDAVRRSFTTNNTTDRPHGSVFVPRKSI